MSTKHAILGLLNERSMYGYEIKKEFEKSVSFIWSINIGQLYTLLKKMENEDEIIKKEISQKNRPDKFVYTIADKGKNKLHKWLSEPVVIRQTKDEFYLKMMFLTQLKNEDAKKYIDKQIDIIQKQLNEFNEIKNTNNANRNKFMDVLLEASIMHFQVDLEWLNIYKERIGSL